jgi:ribosomal protein L11 methyltransferase
MSTRKPRPARRSADPVLAVLTVETDSAHADALAAWAESRFRRPVVQLQRPHGDQVWIEAYFDRDVEALLAARLVEGRPGVRTTGTRLCQARDWQAFWRHHFHAHDVGTRLRIVPVWEAARERGTRRGRLTLLVDPGLSFGTGEHFTTRFCLEMADTLCQKSPLASALDVGTGSGILAMAAARLGVPEGLGVDHDAQALKQARANLAMNRLTRRVKLAVLDITQEAPRGRYDLVLANVYGRILVECAPTLARCATRYLVLSGIREPEVDGVADAYLALGGREIVRDGDGQWAGLVIEWTRSSST